MMYFLYDLPRYTEYSTNDPAPPADQLMRCLQELRWNLIAYLKRRTGIYGMFYKTTHTPMLTDVKVRLANEILQQVNTHIQTVNEADDRDSAAYGTANFFSASLRTRKTRCEELYSKGGFATGRRLWLEDLGDHEGTLEKILHVFEVNLTDIIVPNFQSRMESHLTLQ